MTKLFSYTLALALSVVLISCEKKIAPIDNYAVQVEFKNSSSKAVTGNVTVNPKEEITLDFTISSNMEEMYIVEIQKNGTRVDTFMVSAASARNFSASKTYRIDSIAGDYAYRVLARNRKGIFIGDGQKLLKVTVAPDFYYFTNVKLEVPDSSAAKTKSFLAALTGKTLSYTEGAAASATVDMGYFFDTTTVGAPKHTLYALAASKYAPYNLSAWTKNATVLKRASSPSFTALTSGGSLAAVNTSVLNTGTSTSITALVAGNLVYFRTANGKVGCLQVNFVQDGGAAIGQSFINCDIKIQR